MIRRVLGLGAAACLLAGTTAGGASAAVANGARDIPGQCCLRTLGLKTSAG